MKFAFKCKISISKWDLKFSEIFIWPLKFCHLRIQSVCMIKFVNSTIVENISLSKCEKFGLQLRNFMAVARLHFRSSAWVCYRMRYLSLAFCPPRLGQIACRFETKFIPDSSLWIHVAMHPMVALICALMFELWKSPFCTHFSLHFALLFHLNFH